MIVNERCKPLWDSGIERTWSTDTGPFESRECRKATGLPDCRSPFAALRGRMSIRRGGCGQGCRRKAPSSAAGSPGQVQPDSGSNAVRFCGRPTGPRPRALHGLQHDGSVLRIHVGRVLEVPAGRRLPAPGLGPRPDMVDRFRARRSSVAVQVGIQAGQPPARYRVKMSPPSSSHASRQGSAAETARRTSTSSETGSSSRTTGIARTNARGGG